jgi:hypothetical protein
MRHDRSGDWCPGDVGATVLAGLLAAGEPVRVLCQRHVRAGRAGGEFLVQGRGEFADAVVDQEGRTRACPQ